jgi:tetratricopeptide (TPR) repeat protein
MKQVLVKDETKLIPSYGVKAMEKLPMFAENRIHQRSSGNPYPCRVVTGVERGRKTDKAYRVITIENEYIRLELLPELGGRIYSAYDKRTGYDFFYKQHVIKPALIGLLGNWISGGCEFNWPCHHRPSTFMPVDVATEHESDGSVTVWMSENEPFNRMRGAVGIHMALGEARFETRIKVYNGDASRHSFLWWENVAVPVNEHYRLVFPPDVHYTQFHYRKSVTTYPIATGVYNGQRMGDGRDISYHKNTHCPTSYFSAATKYEFFGGYDEGRCCGLIHVADRTTSVGKKMFTWAYNQLSRSWEMALTDTDGAYAELMASSYSLNQPDFAWLMPYEGKEFAQMWYPVGNTGLPICACAEAVFAAQDNRLHVQATLPLADATLSINGIAQTVSLTPDMIWEHRINGALKEFKLYDARGRVLMTYPKKETILSEIPEPIPDNPTLDMLKSAQEAYIMGVHVEQYRDPAIRAKNYYEESIRRDPEYAPALIALSECELDSFRFDNAWQLARRAWEVLTIRNFHPESGRLQYLMGRIREAFGDEDGAWEYYMQSAWSQDTRSMALTRAAMIDGRRGDYQEMLVHAEEALLCHSHNETATALKIIALRRLGRTANVEHDAMNLTLRALKYGVSDELYDTMHSDARQSALDIVSELSQAGENILAADILAKLPEKSAMTEYVRWYLTGSDEALRNAQVLDLGIAYPQREIEYRTLKNTCDGRAKSLLGCLLYSKGNYADAARLWEEAIHLTKAPYMEYRNLAVAYYSHLHRRPEVLLLLQKALELRDDDGQLIWETAYVMTRLGIDPNETISFLEKHPSTREDVIIEHCRCLNIAGRYEAALELLKNTKFTPCEGGEHSIAEQYMFAHHAMGRKLYAVGYTEEALEQFRLAQNLPVNLGAGLWNEVLLVPHQYFEALCLYKLGKHDEAMRVFEHILILKQDYFSKLYLPELSCWQAMIYAKQGLPQKAQLLLAAHEHEQRQAELVRDAGYYKTTPFFISYMEDADQQRQAAVTWQLAVIHWAAGDNESAKNLAQRSLMGEPTNLYARLLAEGVLSK